MAGLPHKSEQPYEPRALRPPTAPPETHHDDYAALPELVRGAAADRAERARAYLLAARDQVRAQHRAGASGITTARLLTESMNRLVRGLWAELAEELHAPDDAVLVALGSFGRRELSPHSDLDLLLVRPPSSPEEAVRPIAERLQTLLWDLKVAVGWSVRAPSECVRAADDDHTVRTALLDARHLAGPEPAWGRFVADVLSPVAGRRVDAFIQAKVDELRARRVRFGDSVFVLEPHLKQGEGSLRDLEAALWVAEARFRVHGLTGMLRNSILPPGEVEVLRAARDFLMRCRHEAHFLRGRKEDRLTFELQEEVANLFGYVQSDAGLPVEQFMRNYYLAASAIRRAADALIARAEEVPTGKGRGGERRLGRFRVLRGKLTLGEDAELLESEPERMLELLRVADTQGLELASWTRDQLAQATPILHAARAHPKVTGALRALLARPGTRGDFLTQMHELGLLGAVLPEFGRITAFHQHDLYHVYTVDIHSLFALRRLYALRAGDLLAEQPELTREMQALDDPLPLYLGMLFHDAGKGMGGNHSLRGTELMQTVGARLELDARQREIAEFLVMQHLLMSHTAQRRDLSDPSLIAEFARTAGDVEKLTCLYLLSYADICSVGPKMWTDWKARLLKELYDKAKAHLSGERAGEPAVAARPFHEVWKAQLGDAAADALCASLPERYFQSTDPSRAHLHARMLQRARKSGWMGAVRKRPDSDFSELGVATSDRPGLLALLAGVLSAHRIDILRARIASTRDGWALDVFDVRGPGGLLERPRWRAARTDLGRVLRGETTVEDVMHRRRGNALLRKPLPRVTTQVVVDNQASRRFSVVDVRAEDRPGLLYAIASALRGFGALIALAQVSTEAHRATDSFYVTRNDQKIVAPEDVERLKSLVSEAIEKLSSS